MSSNQGSIMCFEKTAEPLSPLAGLTWDVWGMTAVRWVRGPQLLASWWAQASRSIARTIRMVMWENHLKISRATEWSEEWPPQEQKHSFLYYYAQPRTHISVLSTLFQVCFPYFCLYFSLILLVLQVRLSRHNIGVSYLVFLLGNEKNKWTFIGYL